LTDIFAGVAFDNKSFTSLTFELLAEQSFKRWKNKNDFKKFIFS